MLAAWLNHFDSREQNTMDTWISPTNPRGSPTPRRVYVRHYFLDYGDCFGSVWDWDEISRRLGHVVLASTGAIWPPTS